MKAHLGWAQQSRCAVCGLWTKEDTPHTSSTVHRMQTWLFRKSKTNRNHKNHVHALVFCKLSLGLVVPTWCFAKATQAQIGRKTTQEILAAHAVKVSIQQTTSALKGVEHNDWRSPTKRDGAGLVRTVGRTCSGATGQRSFAICLSHWSSMLLIPPTRAIAEENSVVLHCFKL